MIERFNCSLIYCLVTKKNKKRRKNKKITYYLFRLKWGPTLWNKRTNEQQVMTHQHCIWGWRRRRRRKVSYLIHWLYDTFVNITMYWSTVYKMVSSVIDLQPPPIHTYTHTPTHIHTEREIGGSNKIIQRKFYQNYFRWTKNKQKNK